MGRMKPFAIVVDVVDDETLRRMYDLAWRTWGNKLRGNRKGWR